LSIEEAAALPLVVLTGAQLIEKGVQPQSGQTVLILGALGSVGRSAVHVAKQHGMKVIAGVRASQRKKAGALQVSQIVAVDEELEIEALGEVDAIADTVGHGVVEKFLSCLRDNGILATVVGSPDGIETKNIRVQHVWTQPDARRLYELAEAVARGEFSIPIARRMKLSQVREAQAMAEAGGIAKILLIP
jgi:NADPH:quinone reductase-like Zn-dependent oxidoreductase